MPSLPRWANRHLPRARSASAVETRYAGARGPPVRYLDKPKLPYQRGPFCTPIGGPFCVPIDTWPAQADRLGIMASAGGGWIRHGNQRFPCANPGDAGKSRPANRSSTEQDAAHLLGILGCGRSNFHPVPMCGFPRNIKPGRHAWNSRRPSATGTWRPLTGFSGRSGLPRPPCHGRRASRPGAPRSRLAQLPVRRARRRPP